MRVLLINPSWEGLISGHGRRYNRAWPPLDLLNCASLLEADGHSVELVDARASWVSPEAIGRKAESFDRVFITSSPIDRWQCPNLDLDPFLGTVRRLPPDRTHVLGVHGTLLPELVLRQAKACAVVLGEPEFTVRDLCRTDHFSEVAGIAYLEKETLIRTSSRDSVDLNQLPIPAYHRVDLNLYSYELLGRRFVLLEGSRSCPWSCHFCLLEMYGRNYRKREPRLVLRDLEYVIEKQGARNGYFIDLEFTVHRALVEELCSFLIHKRYDFQWTCQTRLDTIHPEMLVRMKKAGCRLIHYGVETGSPRILESIHKRITLEQIRQGMEMTHKAGIETACFFMFGFPGETEEDMQKTVDLAKQLNPTYASFHMAAPYPGTRLHQLQGEETGIPFPESFRQAGPPGELRRRTNRALKQFYLRPGYILSRLAHGNPSSWFRQARLFWNFIQ
jgi:anaerobic magnesium-protoporphyrin IX monomethyl ester cyclase